jgi:hypothetical protein
MKSYRVYVVPAGDPSILPKLFPTLEAHITYCNGPQSRTRIGAKLDVVHNECDRTYVVVKRE